MPTMPTRDGAMIAFSDDGAGVPVVMVPGICCSRRWWEPQREALAGSYRFICVDLRGVGASPSIGHGHRVARYSMDVAELLERLDLREVVLVGWSLGFSVSLGLVELAGQGRLVGLVLVEGSPKLRNDSDWQLGIADLGEGVRMAARLRGEFELAAEDLVRSSFTRPEQDDALPLLLADAGRVDPLSAARLFWDHFNQDWRDALGTISVPTLVVAGTASQIVPGGAAAYTARAIPDARLELFEDAGHALFRERPGRFNALLREFVEHCTARSG